MKTSIVISGQIAGNNKLRIAFITHYSEIYRLPYYSWELKFKTKKEAVKALSEAFKYLKSEEPDFYKNGGITYWRGNSISYDASTAKIIKTD